MAPSDTAFRCRRLRRRARMRNPLRRLSTIGTVALHSIEPMKERTPMTLPPSPVVASAGGVSGLDCRTLPEFRAANLCFSHSQPRVCPTVQAIHHGVCCCYNDFTECEETVVKVARRDAKQSGRDTAPAVTSPQATASRSKVPSSPGIRDCPWPAADRDHPVF